MTSLGFSEDQLDESCAEVTKRHTHSNSRATNRLTRDISFSRDRENDKMSLFMVMGITVLDNICSHVFHVGLHIGTPVPF